MLRSTKLLSCVIALGMYDIVGCQPQSAPPVNPPSASTTDDHNHDGHHEDGHAHEPGPHGGILADWGGGKYHVEFTVDHEKQAATVYVLGSDEKTPAPVKTTDGTLLLTINDPSFQVTLTAAPLEGEADGKSSRYVGTHENLGAERVFAGSMSAEVDGTPYAGDFAEESHADHEHK